MDPCKPIIEELARSCTPPPANAPRSPARESAALQQIFHVVQQLNALLRHAHENEIVLRDLCLENVVFAQLPFQRGWTLLEYTSSVKAGKRSQSLAARRTPPEVCSSIIHRFTEVAVREESLMTHESLQHGMDAMHVGTALDTAAAMSLHGANITL
jgi:hypothetical protein